MSDNKMTGVVLEVGDVQTFASGFKKAIVVIRTDEKYPQELEIEFVKENADNVTIGGKSLKPGDSVVIDYNIRGSKPYNGRRYTSLQGWKWAATDADSHQQPDDAGDGYDGEIPEGHSF